MLETRGTMGVFSRKQPFAGCPCLLLEAEVRREAASFSDIARECMLAARYIVAEYDGSQDEEREDPER